MDREGWEKTKKGRVVYNRRPTAFRASDLLRIWRSFLFDPKRDSRELLALVVGMYTQFVSQDADERFNVRVNSTDVESITRLVLEVVYASSVVGGTLSDAGERLRRELEGI